MELFYSQDISEHLLTLSEEEARHCVKVLRHKVGDEIFVIDGEGQLLKCILTKTTSSCAEAEIVERTPSWGTHPYRLTLAVCPTKNNERFEWFVEKACEIGIDCIVPLIAERSQRKVYKTERARKILVSAAKQSLKAAVPTVLEPLSVRDFLAQETPHALKLIAYCFEEQSDLRKGLPQVLKSWGEQGGNAAGREVIILIGPEGDFSPEEAHLALEKGYIPVHFGNSRMRTETAALFAVSAVYQQFI